jgi:predicted RNA-binding protein with RPS1 domain
MNLNSNSANDFDWDYLDAETARRKKIPNAAILSRYKDNVYNHADYALAYYEELLKIDMPNGEPSVGEAFLITDIVHIRDSEVNFVLKGGFECITEMASERSFIESIGFKHYTDFLDFVSTPEGKEEFLANKCYLVVEQVKPYLKGSITKGQILKTKDEFYEQITNPTSAYFGTILEKNQGGFFVNVQGVVGFLPGSLAAANIVRNFDEMIGKTIPLMVEDYLAGSDTFVFSYKRYVKTVLPQKTNELEVGAQYTGIVTGATKFGVFIEFDDIFTGLLHTSKMSDSDTERFHNRGYRAGDTITFWIQEISYDKKIILTSIDPAQQRKELEDYHKSRLDEVINGEIINVKPFGVTVRLNDNMIGVIPGKELKSKKQGKLNVGENIEVKIGYITNNNRLHLKFADSK